MKSEVRNVGHLRDNSSFSRDFGAVPGRRPGTGYFRDGNRKRQLYRKSPPGWRTSCRRGVIGSTRPGLCDNAAAVTRYLDRDTDIGGPAAGFPATRRSAVLAVGSGDETSRALARERLVTAYWKPVYKYLRIRWKTDNEDAKDWTQGYFA